MKPIRVEKIPGIEHLASLVANESLTKSDLAEIARMQVELQKQSDVLMQEIAKW